MAQNPAELSAKLVGLADPMKGKEVLLTGVVTIGRDQKSNVCTVAHASVSRHHAKVLVESGAWVVEDLNSTNGVCVNDAKTAKARLKDGDVVRIGDIPFKFVLIQAVTQVIPKQAPGAEDDMTLQSVPKSVQAAAAVAAPAATPAAPPPKPAPPPPPSPAQTAPPPPPQPAPAPKPQPPPPAPKPPPPAQTGEAGADLFEPSIIGGNVGAALAAGSAQAAAAAAAAAPARPASREPEDFEGTMYGPQVARQLVKAIREEKQDEAAASAQAGAKPGVAAAPRGSKTPNFFWLKIKFFVFLLIFFGLVGGLVYWAKVSGEKEDVFRKAKSDIKNKIEAFGREDEEKTTHNPAEQLATLDALDKKLKDLSTEFQRNEKWLEDLQSLDSRVSFLIFERKVGAAVDARNLKEADQLIEDMSAKGSPEQRDLMPMVKLAAHYEVFGAKYPEPPARATDVVAKAEVSELAACDADFVRQYRNKGKEVEAQFKLISRMVADADSIRERLVSPWNTFWSEYGAYEKAKSPEKLADLQKTYPKLKMVQDLK